MPPRSKRKQKKVRQLRIVTDSEIQTLLSRCGYQGHPHHKFAPGNFCLHPPAAPRRTKTLCDQPPFNVGSQSEAETMLIAGIQRKMISEEADINGLPKFVWFVRISDGAVFEARLGGSRSGLYHGYPLQNDDANRLSVMRAWKERSP